MLIFTLIWASLFSSGLDWLNQTLFPEPPPIVVVNKIVPRSIDEIPQKQQLWVRVHYEKARELYFNGSYHESLLSLQKVNRFVQHYKDSDLLFSYAIEALQIRQEKMEYQLAMWASTQTDRSTAAEPMSAWEPPAERALTAEELEELPPLPESFTQ